MAELRFKCVNRMRGNEHPQRGMSIEFVPEESGTEGVTVTGSIKLKTDDPEAADKFEIGKTYTLTLSEDAAEEGSKPQPFSTKKYDWPEAGQVRQMAPTERGPERNAVRLEGSGAAAAAAAKGEGAANVKVKDDAPSTLNKK